MELFFTIGFETFEEVFKSIVVMGFPLKVIGNVKERGGFLSGTDTETTPDGLKVSNLGLGRGCKDDIIQGHEIGRAHV